HDGSQEDLGKLLEYCRNYLLKAAGQDLSAELQAKLGESDVVQQTFVKATSAFPRFRGSSEAELLAWLRRILHCTRRNIERHYWRAEKRRLSREVSLDG